MSILIYFDVFFCHFCHVCFRLGLTIFCHLGVSCFCICLNLCVIHFFLSFLRAANARLQKTENWKNYRKMTKQLPKTRAKVRFFRHLQALPQMPGCKENKTWMTENNKKRQPQMTKNCTWQKTTKTDKRQWQKKRFSLTQHLLVSNCYCKTIDLPRAALSVTIRCWCFVQVLKNSSLSQQL